MTRYFEEFLLTPPMVELERAVALASPGYVERVDAPTPRFRVILDGELSRVVYTERATPAEALEDFRRHREGARGEIYTPVQRGPEGSSYRVWYITPAGEIESLKEYRLNARGKRQRETWFTPAGERLGWREFAYDEEGLLEVRTYDAAGGLVSREEP